MNAINKISFSEKLYQIGLFGFGFFMTLHDLPRIPLFGFELRVGILFFIFILAGFYSARKNEIFDSFKNYRLLWVSLLFFLIYTTLNCFTIDPTKRSIGFLIWLYINATVFSLMLIKPRKILIYGLTATITLNVFYIFLQHYFFDLIWLPERFAEFTYVTDLVRAFGLFGEPSYGAMNLAFLYLYLMFFKLTPWKKLDFFLKSMTILAILFTYSRTGIVIICTLIPWDLYLSYKRSLRKGSALLAVFLALFLVSAVNSRNYYPFINLKLKEIERVNAKEYFNQYRKFKMYRTEDEYNALMIEDGSQFRRIISLKRGWLAFVSNPIFGVGLANSKDYLEKRNFLEELGEVNGLYNLFLEIAVELGSIGVFLFLFLIFTLLYYAYRKNALLAATFMLYIVFIPMQVCQNINMPPMWMAFYFVVLNLKSNSFFQRHEK